MRPPLPRLALARTVALCALLGPLGLASCQGAGRSADRLPPEAPPTSSPLPDVGAWVEATLAEMTLEEKVSQLFSSYAYAYFKSADSPAYRRLVDLVERFGVGGVIFFQGEPTEQAVLANDLQSRARWPLLVSQDMEWGAGMRIERATTLPRTMAFGAARDAELAYAAGYLTAQEARAVGVHQIFAPVADVNNNPQNPIINVRAYGERPALVAEMVGAFVRGAQAGGVIATAKHFPGHGDTATDSHLGLPVLPHNRPRLDSLELVPFRAAIESGVMSIMTGHLAFPEVEPDADVPASLSKRVTTGLLREELGFGGLVVTDALNMSGVAKGFGTGEAAVRALEAGADMLLFSNDEYAARAAILRALRDGRLDESRIDASVRRVLQAKAWAGLDQKRQVELVDVRRRVSSPLHAAFGETVARASLTLLRNENDLLPLLGGEGRRILSVALSDGESPSTGDTFHDHLRRAAPTSNRITTRLLDRRSHATDYARVLREAARYDVVLVPTYVRVRSWSGRIRLSAEHQRFLDGLVAEGTPVVLISFGNPYLALGLDQPAAYVAAYGAADVSQEAAAEALFGQAPFAGRLPISIPGLYAYGDGLQLPQVAPRRGHPEAVGMTTQALFPVDSLLRAAIADRAFPGAAVAIGRGDVVAKVDGYGYFTYDALQPVTARSLFDLASLTKVVATTTAAMLLYEEGRLDLDAPVARYLPAFGQSGKEAVTIRQLLTHTAGLVPFRPFYQMDLEGREAVLDAILAEGLVYEPGTESRYSDLGFITLALVVEEIAGRPFAEYAREAIFEPLGMTSTGFRRTDVGGDTTVVPTEVDEIFRKRLVQGEVHDETAFLLGGTAGHAGLFSTAEDLARFAAMLTSGGRANGRPFLKPETIGLFTAPVDPTRRRHTRALGWDTKSPEGYSSAGRHFGPGSFGHTGFTGTSLWIDPDQQLFVILLTNRVYPTRENRRHVAVRPQLADIAYEAIAGPPAPLLPGPAEATDEGRLSSEGG